MCGNFALWYVICFRRGDRWSPFLVHSIISVLFFRRGSADDVHFSRIISYDGTLAVFWIKPPLRLSGTSPQEEVFCSHRGELATQLIVGWLVHIFI